MLFGRKSMTNLDSILKSRDVLSNKGPSSQSYGFSSSHVCMLELDHKEGWAVKNWCFQIVLGKTLESPLDSKEIKPVNPKGNQASQSREIQPEYWLERLMLKLNLQYFGYLIRRADSLDKTLMLGKIEGRRRRGRQRMKWLDSITDSWIWIFTNSGRQGSLMCHSPMGSQKVKHDLMTAEVMPFSNT